MPKIYNHLIMNTATKVSLGQKRWLSKGASTLIMASMLFFVQVSSNGGEISEAYVSVQKISYLSNPDFEEKKLMSTEVNPTLMEFITELEDPTVKGGVNSPGTRDLEHTLKQMEDLEIRFTIHQTDPHYDPRAAKKRLLKLRNQLKEMSSDLNADILFKNPVHDTE